ncbi:MAG: hypothetical protein WAM42_01635, partial [Candidatus Nitrosopolaris sp.]
MDVCRKSVKIAKHQGNVQIVAVKNVAVGGVSILIDNYALRIGIMAISLFFGPIYRSNYFLDSAFDHHI